MLPLCVLFAHHRSDAVTCHHLDTLRRQNSCPVIPICNGSAEHVAGAVDLSRFSIQFSQEHPWARGDAMLYLWFRHCRSVEAQRYAYIEWDTLATMPLEEYYASVWDADAAAAQVKTPETTPEWEWFRLHGSRLPERLRPFAAGLAPLNGVLLSRAALQAVCDLEIPKNVFSELRLGTLLRSCGIPLRAFEPKYAATNQWRADLITVSDEPGVYHPVKSLLPESSGGASRDAVMPPDQRAGRALSVTVQMPQRAAIAAPKPQSVVASRGTRTGTVLFTWELGGGIGHLMQTLPLARELKRRGHRVVVAARDLSRAHAVFGENTVELLQAPFKPGRAACPVEPPSDPRGQRLTFDSVSNVKR